MQTTKIDFTPLLTSVPPADVAAWKARAKADGAAWASLDPRLVITMVLTIPAVLVMIGVGLGPARSIVSAAMQSKSLGYALLPLLIFLGFLASVALVVARTVGSLSKDWELWVRMDRFAHQNGMKFSPLDTNPSYPGTIFQLGNKRKSLDHLMSSGGRFFDFGNYRYTTGSGKNQTTRTWGFLAFNLDRKLPHMVLDSKSNNSLFGTNLPAAFDRDQVLSLEGDFDRHFTLYCPEQYERDALYVFTPDLMALLIDEAAPFDVEIIDDWMFVYSSSAFRTGDATLYARLFRIIETVGAKTLAQTDRYVDKRIGNFDANIVAPAGARLKRTVSISAIVVGVVVAVVWVWGFVGDGLLR